MKKQSIINLENKIKQASQDYYTGNESISDNEFDELVDELKQLDPTNETISKVGWGYDIEEVKGDKVAHVYGKVGSLDKIHDVSEIPNSFSDGAFLLAKLDGASCVAYYQDGKLTKAVSRGNGLQGVDKTKQYEKIVNKYTLNLQNFTGAVRGEIVFSNSMWEQYKNKYPDAKFPRNIATGLFMRDEVSEDLSFVDFVPYKIQGSETIKEWFPSHLYLEILKSLNSWGFPQIEYEFVDTTFLTNNSMETIFSKWETYPMDGIVIQDRFFTVLSDNSFEYKNIAYKFKAEEKETTVKEVIWNLSKNNIMVPVVCVEPVELSGALVQKTSGFNYKYIVDNKIGKGAVIKMMRSGEVIPKINKVVFPSLVVTAPETCPVCGMPLTQEGVELVCSNPNCLNIEYSRLLSWLRVIGIRDLLGVGDIMLEDFVQLWKSTIYTTQDINLTVYDLYDKEYGVIVNKDYLINKLTPSAKEKFSQIIDNLSKPVTMDKLIVAANIRGLGETVSKKIASTIYECITDWNNVHKLTSIDGIGNDVKNRVLNARNIISKVFCLVEVVDPLKQVFSGSNTQITVTGSLSMPRKQFEAVCASKNIVLSDNVKSSKYLVTNNPLSGSSKIKNAAKYSIPIISEEEFRKLFGV